MERSCKTFPHGTLGVITEFRHASCSFFNWNWIVTTSLLSVDPKKWKIPRSTLVLKLVELILEFKLPNVYVFSGVLKFSVLGSCLFVYSKNFQFWDFGFFGLEAFLTFCFMELDTWFCHRKLTSLGTWLLFFTTTLRHFRQRQTNYALAKFGLVVTMGHAQKIHAVEVIFWWSFCGSSEKHYPTHHQEYSSLVLWWQNFRQWVF